MQRSQLIFMRILSKISYNQIFIQAQIAYEFSSSSLKKISHDLVDWQLPIQTWLFLTKVMFALSQIIISIFCYCLLFRGNCQIKVTTRSYKRANINLASRKAHIYEWECLKQTKRAYPNQLFVKYLQNLDESVTWECICIRILFESLDFALLFHSSYFEATKCSQTIILMLFLLKI